MNSKFSKIISLTLAAVMSFGLCAFADGEDQPMLISAPAPSFTDVIESDWAYESIMELASKGVISGTENGELLPDNNITRQEAAKLLVEVRGYKSTDTSDIALNVADPQTVSDWALGYVSIAMEKDILTGNDKGEINGTGVVTRAELATMIVRSIHANTDSYITSSFTDIADDAWYAENVECAKTLGIVTGFEDGTFKGEQTVTRREAFVMIQRLVRLLDALEA